MKTTYNKIASHKYVRFAVAIGILSMFALAGGAPAVHWPGG